jgi:predicted transglutaminase-like cysteine proteinase
MQDQLETLNKIHKLVHNSFTYVPDKKNYNLIEHWTSHAEEVKLGKKFKDDCDGFALTCAELCIEAGFNRSDVRVIICQTETGEWHLVCGVNTEDDTIILENRYSKPYFWKSKRDYVWHKSMNFSKPGKWYFIGE